MARKLPDHGEWDGMDAVLRHHSNPVAREVLLEMKRGNTDEIDAPEGFGQTDVEEAEKLFQQFKYPWRFDMSDTQEKIVLRRSRTRERIETSTTA